ncbi:ABC transporter ATP-binding protein [Paenibacillus tyrfis]|uniref:ABC transporter ATP-binding protein n=1 Tax=Paenibacillus tyrfis TaxID=1501230 RepID=UPI00209CFD51|nr:ABC transporter ATP-binding protein [Paenibacillus tyrfis]MCP1311182.1 ABC transporter ATP-binding protein/permease [Paenibacillus tyrfis]
MLTESSPVFRRLVRYVKPYSFWVAVTVVASLALAAIEIILGKFFERMVNGGAVSASMILFLLAGMILIGMPCRYLIKYASARFSVKVLRDLRNELVRRFGDMPLSQAERKLTGDLISRLTGDTALLQNFFIQHFANLFYLPIVFIGALTLLLLTHWKLVLFSLVLFPLGMLVAGLLTHTLRSTSEQIQDTMGQLNALAQDSIGGLAVMKAFNAQTIFYQKYSELTQHAVKLGLRLEKRYAALGPIAILFLAVPVIFVVVYGGHLIRIGELNAGSLILFLYLLPLALQPISLAPTLIAQLQEASGASRRLFHALDWPVERQTGSKEQAGSWDVPVSVDLVSFSYDSKTNVLDDISFQLNREETLAIVGASGGGKTTIFKLLCGFYELEPGEGTIRMFGRPLSEWDLSALRSNISVVSQDSYLFPATVADNIGFGRLGATREEIMAAAQAANAHDFIEQLPQGYDTMLGERGGGLSGGQRQRIAIARAMLRQSPLILLDEPTSALDTVSESFVHSALKRLADGRSVMVIAHRLSTILQADRILVLDQGRIAESGTHDELLAQNGVYKKLYLHQLTKEDETAQGTASRKGGADCVLQTSAP